MVAPKPATEELQVIENIETFDREMHHSSLRDMIAYVRHWYAIQTPEKGWVFGPSKFIGYVGMNHKIYDQSFDDLDGRATENSLKQWFVELSPTDKLAQTLLQQLRRLIAQHGKTVNALARIHVLKGEVGRPEFARRPQESEGWRVTSDPGILAGKPCIRGMRIRVADILEMLAQGATRKEILEDYPYLEDGDITAALEFAMGAVDHRLVKAA
jgi:uncharacterized protein (DUF433 family)